MHGLIPEPYTAFAERVMADFQQHRHAPSMSAEAIWRRGERRHGPVALSPAGPDAVALAQYR